MAKHHSNRITTVRITIVFLFSCIGLAGFCYSLFTVKTLGSGREETKTVSASDLQSPQSKYSKFSHRTRQHRRSCNTCHKFPSSNWKSVRKSDEAFPDITDYPKHQSCLNCHRRQFFSGPRPVICRICHTNPSPRNSSRHPFPNPRERFDLTAKGKRSISGFDINFPHELHLAMLGSNTDETDENSGLNKGFIVKAALRKSMQSETCAMCHSIYKPQGDSDDEYVTKPPEELGDAFWLKKGTFVTSPKNHTQCFTCHSADSGMSPEPSDCGTCHKLKSLGISTDFAKNIARDMKIEDKNILAPWQKRNSSAVFRHEWFSHAEIDCATCHKPSSIDPADPKNKTVAVTACNTCHITATSDDGGILNFEIDSRKNDPKFECVKCHLGYRGSDIPESHIKAITDLGGK